MNKIDRCKCYNKGDINKVFRINNQDGTKNNGCKLEKFMFRREVERNWVSNRVVDEWNGLGNHIDSAETMGSFKRRLDEFMDEDDRWN